MDLQEKMVDNWERRNRPLRQTVKDSLIGWDCLTLLEILAKARKEETYGA